MPTKSSQSHHQSCRNASLLNLVSYLDGLQCHLDSPLQFESPLALRAPLEDDVPSPVACCRRKSQANMPSQSTAEASSNSIVGCSSASSLTIMLDALGIGPRHCPFPSLAPGKLVTAAHALPLSHIRLPLDKPLIRHATQEGSGHHRLRMIHVSGTDLEVSVSYDSYNTATTAALAAPSLCVSASFVVPACHVSSTF